MLISNIPGLRIIELVGRGGMSEIYHAKTNDNLSVAVKVMIPRGGEPEAHTRRFLYEMQALAKLRHPNVIHCFDVGRVDSSYYIVMEYLPNASLRMIMDRESLSISTIIKILKDISAGLQYAHSLNYVHRDIKPENVLLRPNGTAVLADFGIAKALDEFNGRLTSTGTSIGTPYYMSPEQARGKELDYRSDIYSLGCLVFEMLSGSPPYTGTDIIEVGLKHITEKPPKLPSRYIYWAPIVEQLLAKNVADRYQSLRDFIIDMDNLEKSGQADVYSYSLSQNRIAPTEVGSKKIFKTFLYIALGLVLAFGSAGIGFVFFPQYFVKKSEQQEISSDKLTQSIVDKKFSVELEIQLENLVQSKTVNAWRTIQKVLTSQNWPIEERKKVAQFLIKNEYAFATNNREILDAIAQIWLYLANLAIAEPLTMQLSNNVAFFANKALEIPGIHRTIARSIVAQSNTMVFEEAEKLVRAKKEKEAYRLLTFFITQGSKSEEIQLLQQRLESSRSE